MLALLTLELEARVLRLLFHLRLLDELLEVVQLLRQVLVNVRTLRVRHLNDSIAFGVQDLDLLPAEVELLAGLGDLLLDLDQRGVEAAGILALLRVLPRQEGLRVT